MTFSMMDAFVLEKLELAIAENPHDEDLKRCYAIAYNSIHFKKLAKEKQEAVMAEIKDNLK